MLRKSASYSLGLVQLLAVFGWAPQRGVQLYFCRNLFLEGGGGGGVGGKYKIYSICMYEYIQYYMHYDYYNIHVYVVEQTNFLRRGGTNSYIERGEKVLPP